MHLLLIHSGLGLGLGLVALGLGLIALGLGLGLGLDLVASASASASYTSGLVNIPVNNKVRTYCAKTEAVRWLSPGCI